MAVDTADESVMRDRSELKSRQSPVTVHRFSSGRPEVSLVGRTRQRMIAAGARLRISDSTNLPVRPVPPVTAITLAVMLMPFLSLAGMPLLLTYSGWTMGRAESREQ